MKKLGIIDVGQFPASSNEACGVACILAILRWKGLAGKLTLDDLIRETSLSDGAKGLTCAEVAVLGMAHGLDMRVERATTQELITHIDAGRPAICLLNYKDVPRDLVEDKPFMGEHFEIFEGYDPDGGFAFMDDPDRIDIGSKWGTDIPYTLGTVDKALHDSEMPNQVVVCYGVKQLEAEHAAYANSEGGLHLRVTPSGYVMLTIPDKASMWVLPDNMVDVGGEYPQRVRVQYDPGDGLRIGWVAQALIATEPPAAPIPEPLPLPAPLPTQQPDIAHVNVADGVHLRRDAGVTSTILLSIPENATVNRTGVYQPGDKLLWAKVIYAGLIGWCDSEYLTTGRAPQAAPDPIIAPHRRLGPHMMGTLNAADLDAVAHSYGLYKGTDADGYLVEMQRVNPKAIFIRRDYGYHAAWQSPDHYVEANGGIDAAADKWIADMRPALRPDWYFESFNEAKPTDTYLAFEAARAIKLHKLGFKACLLNTAVANMETADWSRARAMVKASIDTGSLIGVHCYAQSVLFSDYAGAGFDASGIWQGETFTDKLDMDGAYTGLRVLRDVRDLIAQGQAGARLVVTELGLDDLGGAVHYPSQGKTKGWRTCVDVWRANRWLTGATTPEEFYRKQLNWWATIVSRVPQIAGATVYTYGTDDEEWKPYDVRGVL